jgi:hypothetical protein
MARAAQEQKAVGLLENPLQYSGLPEKKFRRVLLRARIGDSTGPNAF